MQRTFAFLLILLSSLPLSSSKQVVFGVAGKPISLPCPGFGGGPCSWNISTSSSRVSIDFSSCEIKLNPLLPEDTGVHKCNIGHVELYT